MYNKESAAKRTEILEFQGGESSTLSFFLQVKSGSITENSIDLSVVL